MVKGFVYVELKKQDWKL